MRRLAALLALALVAGCTAATPTPASPPTSAEIPDNVLATAVAVASQVAATQAAAQASAASTSAPASAATTTAAASTANGCRTGNPLANVYHPTRLTVLAPCRTATGTVGLVRHEDDGDYHIQLQLDAGEGDLVNTQNLTDQDGALVVEIVPADEPGCTVGTPPKPPSGTYDYGICTGANVAPPVVGEHVSVIGPWVLDADHGWREIHPAWVVAPVGTSVPPPPPAAPAPTPTPVSPADGAAAVTFTSVVGGRPGGTASVSVQTAPGASCVLAYVTPAGTKSTAAGLGGKTADSSGVVSWSWKIGSSTKPGTGTVSVVCNGASATSPITIG